MRIKVLPLEEVEDRHLGRWRELASQAAEPNPFFEPEFVLPQARGLNAVDEVSLVVALAGEEWHGCLPVHRPRRWHKMPVRGLVSWRGDEFFGLLGTPLLSDSHKAAAAVALLEEISRSTPRLGYSALEWLATEADERGQVAEIIADQLQRPFTFDRFERATVRRRPEPDYTDALLSSKRKRELRRQRRKLGETMQGEPEIVDRSGEAAAYDEFVALEARARKSAAGTVIADDPGRVQFFREMCTSFAALGRLQLLELQCSGKTIAAKCNLRAGDTLFMLKIAFDEQWASHSPGILLELDMLKFFHERTDAKIMDSCASPGNRMINRLWPDRRTITSYALPGRGPGGETTRLGLTAAHSLRDRAARRKKEKTEKRKQR